MAHLLVTNGARASTQPLAAATLVGRGASCLVRFDDPAVPAHWLEIRWRGDGWAWRTLSAEERTRGTGAFLENGWRRMESIDGRGTRVSVGDSSVELVAGGPPGPFVWDLVAERAVEGAAMDEVVELRGADLLPLHAEGDAALALRDGQCWLHEGANGPRLLRAHVPQRLAPTTMAALDLRAGQVVAEFDLNAHSLVLTRGDVQVEVRGACVRALAVYAVGERPDPWLTAADAWCRWVELGGSRDAPVDAVGWERGRLRRILDRAGVAGLDLLVERRKVGSFIQTRLGGAIVRVVVHA